MKYIKELALALVIGGITFVACKNAIAAPSGGGSHGKQGIGGGQRLSSGAHSMSGGRSFSTHSKSMSPSGSKSYVGGRGPTSTPMQKPTNKPATPQNRTQTRNKSAFKMVEQKNGAQRSIKKMGAQNKGRNLNRAHQQHRGGWNRGWHPNNWGYGWAMGLGLGLGLDYGWNWGWYGGPGLWWGGYWWPWNEFCSAWGPQWGWGYKNCLYYQGGQLPVHVREYIISQPVDQTEIVQTAEQIGLEKEKLEDQESQDNEYDEYQK